MLNQSLALLTFGKISGGRCTFGQLREITKVKRGLSWELEELKANGRIHYTLDANGQIHDDTVISLCTTIKLERDYKLTILAPDEAEPIDGQSVWKILVHGTPDAVLALEGLDYPAGWPIATICWELKGSLYIAVSSSVVDATWPRVQEDLEILYEQYASRLARAPRPRT